ncbi:MAG: DEAD/DEAH box helicase family protein [Akkermansiaceae bacterium]
MNEAETRAEHIDPALKAAGWGVVEGSRILREYHISPGRIEGRGRRGTPEIADYVLVYRNIKLAVNEAKAWDKAVTEGVAQAKAYAKKMEIRFTFATNGQGIYGIDMETGKEGEIPKYPSPDELWDMTFAKQNRWRDYFSAIPFEDRGGYFQGRYYQDISVERVLEAIAAGNLRILLTLATGTGKTFIAFQIAWKLFHSRWNLSGEPTRRPRILFLADRNILANQAYNAFSAFPEDAMVRIEPSEKTLVFCATQAHALFVRDCINQISTSTNPDYCHRVTADDGALGELHLRDFQDNEKSIPTILTTSQKIIDAEKSDIFDVLSYVAYTSPPVTREFRAGKARQSIHGLFSDKQQAFLDFVLSHYISVGVEELDMAKLSPLLHLKYHDSISDALADLGSAESISEVFSGFQKFLYERVA